MIDPKALAALVAGVSGQDAVYNADLAPSATVTSVDAPPSPVDRVQTSEDVALDGVAHYVFNTLRGTANDVDGATYNAIRALIAASRVVV